MRLRKTLEKAYQRAKIEMATTRATSWQIKGVEEIAGRGLVKLGKWCEARQKQYRKLLVRVQQMIVGVTLAEKEERANGALLKTHYWDTIRKSG